MSQAPSAISDSVSPRAMPRSRALRGMVDRVFVIVCVVAAFASIAILLVLLASILIQALGLRFDSNLGYMGFGALCVTASVSAVVCVSMTVGFMAGKRSRRRAIINSVSAGAFILATCAAWGMLHQSDGHVYLSGTFLKGVPSRHAEQAGIYPAMIGSIFICGVCAFTAIPIGIGTAVLLEEFKPRNPVARKAHNFIQLNITNLAGVPSVVYGILGLTAFVQMFNVFGNALEPTWTLGTLDDWYYLQVPLGRGVLAGGLTLMLVVLPTIIVATQESLRAVPDSLRQGALALGATKWQTVWNTSLPAAVPGIMTGAILSMSRAIGEAAPLLIISGIVYITFTPNHLMDDFTVMPLQIYDWASRPQQDFHDVAAAGIVVLLTVLLTFNVVAVFIRQKFQKPLS